jgi:endonuclease G
MAFTQHLSNDLLIRVIKAMLDLGWGNDSSIDALTATMPPNFVGSITGSGNGATKLTVMCGHVNRTRVLVSGDVPMAQLLSQAILLAGGRPEEVLFREALETMSADGSRDVSTPAGEARSPDLASVPADQGHLEIAIGEDDTIEVDFLIRGVAAARSIAKLLVHRHFNQVPSFVAGNNPDFGKGTGWLLAPRLLITNFHVINARLVGEGTASDADFALQGANTAVSFDYLADDSSPVVALSTACVASSAELDYALLRLPELDPTRPPLRLRTNPILRPQGSALRERVNVLQHPDGRPMRLGFRNNFVVTGTESRLSYLTDTAGGSSGSPSCDDKWFVAALHRGYATIDGDPVMVWGTPIRQENYGTPIGVILSDLEERFPDLHAEVLAGQAALS